VINVEWFVSVFLGALLASTIGTVVSFYTIKTLVKRDRDISGILKVVRGLDARGKVRGVRVGGKSRGLGHPEKVPEVRKHRR